MKTVLNRFKKYILKYRWAIISLCYIFILIDIFFIDNESDRRYIGILLLYIISTFYTKLRSKITFFFCLFLLLIVFTKYLMAGSAQGTEKAAVWLVLVFIIGIIQQLRE